MRFLIVGRSLLGLYVALVLVTTVQAEPKKAPPRPVTSDQRTAQTAERATGADAASTDPWFKWEAEAKIDISGPEPQMVKRYGRVQAGDLKTARPKAEAEFQAMIDSQFTGLAKIVAGTLKMDVKPVTDPTIQGPVADHVNVQIYVNLTCFSAWEFESTLPFVGGTKVVDQFIVKAAVEADGKVENMEGSITTFGRRRNLNDSVRRLMLWQGPVYLDDSGKAVTVKLDQVRARVDIGPDGWPEETTSIGKFRIILHNKNGRLLVTLQPLEHAKVAGTDTGLVTRATLSCEGNVYRASIAVTCPEETAALRAESKKRQDERNKKLQPTVSEAVQVFSGSVTQDIYDKLNKRRSQVGLGRVIVMTPNPEAGATYVNRVYPNKANMVKIVKDQKEAEDYLRSEWQEMVKKPPFNGYDFIPDTLKIQVTPKTGETLTDKLMNMPGRKRP